MRRPDFLIGGAAKSGTTTLYQYLAQHPSVFLPLTKEPFFFSVPEDPGVFEALDPSLRAEFVASDDAYEQLFAPARADQLIGEASTSYLYTADTTIRNVRRRFGRGADSIRWIFILRNPVERAFSHYMFMVRRGVEREGLAQALNDDLLAARRPKHLWDLDYLGAGHYTERLRSFIEEFPAVRVFLFEELANPDKIWTDLTSFLGLSSDVPIVRGIEANPSGRPRIPWLSAMLSKRGPIRETLKATLPAAAVARGRKLKATLERKLLVKERLDDDVRRLLNERYHEEIATLGELLGRDLSAWSRGERVAI